MTLVTVGVARRDPAPTWYQGGVDEFWGDRSKLTGLDTLRCKGNWLASRPRYVRDTWGDEMLARVSERLEERERGYFDKSPMPFMWHPFEALCLIDEKIVEVPMQGDVTAMRAFGGAMTDYDLNMVYRAFFRLGTPEFLLSKTHLLWRQYASAGRLASKVEKGEATLALEEVVIPRYLCTYGICGYLGAATVAAGGTNVRSEHTACVHLGDPVCRYALRWDRAS